MDGSDPPVAGIGHGGATAGPLHGGAVHSVRAAAESQTLGILAREGRRDQCHLVKTLSRQPLAEQGI